MPRYFMLKTSLLIKSINCASAIGQKSHAPTKGSFHRSLRDREGARSHRLLAQQNYWKAWNISELSAIERTVVLM